jgi:uncharacterized membrane protein YfcA
VITDPAFYVTAATAVLVVGIAKGGLAGGVGMVGVPLMALTIGPVRAAAIMLPILMVMDVFALRAWWRYRDVRLVVSLLPGAALGTAIGWAAFGLLSADAVRVLIGAIAIFYGMNSLVRRASTQAKPPSPGRATFWSTLSGFTSFGIHAGGPPLHVYLLSLGIDKARFQSTTVVFFFVVNWLKLGPYALLGQLDGRNLATSAVLMPLAPLGIWLGTLLHHRLNERLFYRVVYLSLVAIGAKLAYDGLA